MPSENALHLSILLPQARVGLYVLDETTLKAAESLKIDWRFARVTFELMQGNVQNAIAHYQTNSSPDLLFVETKIIDDSFTKSLETLAETCSDNTSAIVIGPVNDVYLYRKLIDMGVSDYLVGGQSKEALADVIAKTLVTKMGHSSSKLIAFSGAKGGIGTSTLAQYTSLITSEIFKEKTLLFDVSGAWSFTSIAMGVDPSTSLTELCRLVQGTDQDAFKRLIYSLNEKLSILPTGLEKLLDDSVGEDQFEILLNHLMSIYPIIIVDVSASPSNLKRLILNRAHEIVIISNPTTSSLRTARSLINEIKDLHGSQDDNIDLIVTMVDMAKESEVHRSDIEAVIDKKPFGYLLFAPKAYLNAEQGGKRRLNDPALQDMIGLLTKFCGLVLKQSITASSNENIKPQTKLSQFISSLTSKK